MTFVELENLWKQIFLFLLKSLPQKLHNATLISILTWIIEISAACRLPELKEGNFLFFLCLNPRSVILLDFVYVWRTLPPFLASNGVLWTFYFPVRAGCLFLSLYCCLVNILSLKLKVRLKWSTRVEQIIRTRLICCYLFSFSLIADNWIIVVMVCGHFHFSAVGQYHDICSFEVSAALMKDFSLNWLVNKT